MRSERLAQSGFAAWILADLNKERCQDAIQFPKFIFHLPREQHVPNPDSISHLHPRD